MLFIMLVENPMQRDELYALIERCKNHISTNLDINKLQDEELYNAIEDIVFKQLQGIWIPIEQRVSIVEELFSSIRLSIRNGKIQTDFQC